MSASTVSTTAPVPAEAAVPASVPPLALTTEELRRAFPDKLKKSVNQELIDQINKTLSDPDMYENYRENLLSYARVMADGRFKVQEYVNAVKYVSHKLLGCSNYDAYAKTFPEKIARFLAQGVVSKDIHSYVTAYNKSKLVNLVLEQTLVPSYVLNQDLYQKALNVQAELMITAKSEKVRSDAANSLLTHLKMPETQKVELNVGVKEDSAVEALRASVLALAARQREMVQAGAMNAREVAGQRLTIEGEVVDG